MGTAAACFSNLWPTARMGDVSWVYRSLMPEVSPSHDIARFTLCFLCRAGQEYRTVLRLRDLLRLHADYFQLITNSYIPCGHAYALPPFFEKLHTIARKISAATPATGQRPAEWHM
jgi:hypothetical protein